MTEITAATIKALRARTSAGMMDCKRALAASGGDMEASIDWLRQKGYARMAKKSSREAREGLIAIAIKEKRGALVELSSETDFVARNEVFEKTADMLAHLALEHRGDQEQIVAKAENDIRDVAMKLGENISLKRAAFLEAKPDGVIAAYMHNKQNAHLGKIGVLVAISPAASEVAHKIAMHISAAQPAALTRGDIDPALIKRERDVLVAQARQQGKPENIIEKMVEGRLNKFYQQMALVEQDFILDEEQTVTQILDQAGARVDGFSCFVLGED